jgi:hypothetical protein
VGDDLTTPERMTDHDANTRARGRTPGGRMRASGSAAASADGERRRGAQQAQCSDRRDATA